MSATLFFNGIRISVPTNELAEALRQLGSLSVQPATRSAPPPREAAPGLELFGQSENSLDVFTEKRSEVDITRAFLKTIEDHKLSGGAPISAVMAVLGAAHAKGVGSKTAIVNKVLDKFGFAIPDVYTNDRDSLGMRNWRMGPRFDEALRMVSPGRGHEEEEPEDPNEL